MKYLLPFTVVTMKRADIIASIFGISLSFIIFYITADFPEDQVVRAGPAFFPRLLAAGFLIVAVLSLVTSIICQNKLSRKMAEGSKE